MSKPLAIFPLRRIESGPLRGLSTHQVFITLVIATLVALGLDFTFESPLWFLWIRCVIVAAAALLVFVAAGNLHLVGWRRQLARIVGITLTVPIVVTAIYVAWQGGDVMSLLQNWHRINGWIVLSVTGFVVGGTAALVYMLMESAGETKAQALRFELERKTLEAQALAAQMRAMQAQVEPHFLFNTLANVQQLVELQSPRAAPLLGNLIGYLRAAVPQMRTDMTTLEREFDMARNYLAIMQMRMPDRLRWRVELPDTLKAAPIPPLAVMTLVENAVSHGIDPTENGGEVSVLAQADGGSISIVVSDTGAGFAEAAAEGFGLKHLRERIAILWGTRASLQLTQNAPRGTIAALTLPIA